MFVDFLRDFGGFSRIVAKFHGFLWISNGFIRISADFRVVSALNLCVEGGALAAEDPEDRRGQPAEAESDHRVRNKLDKTTCIISAIHRSLLVWTNSYRDYPSLGRFLFSPLYHAYLI